MAQPTGSWVVRVPASSANLGAGFDVLGMAVTLHADVGTGAPIQGGRQVDVHHPAAVAFRRLGGSGPLWMRSPIPIGRGLGFSGAARVGGAAAAVVQRDGPAALGHDGGGRAEVLAVTAELEHHADNVAASIYGGVVVAAGAAVTRVPMAFDPAVVVWIPASTTSTDSSRSRLPDMVSRTDAVFNLGRVATFVAACASGDHAALRLATEDRLHQPLRLAHVPESAAALDAALAAGAWAAWLSGSGPTIAALCDTDRAHEIAAALPGNGHVKVLRVDHAGVAVVAPVIAPVDS